MTKTQAERLLTLAWFLRTRVPEDRFNTLWFISDDADFTENPLLDNCGTSACALGWCTVVFPKMFHWGSGFRNDGLVCHEDFDVHGGSRVVQKFFGITESQGDRIFGQQKRTTTQEAELIERIVGRYGWEYA